MAIFDKPWGNYALEGFIQTEQPSNISWLPQTIAWKLIAAAIALYVLAKIYKKIKCYRHNRYRREALLCIEQLLRSNDRAFLVQHLQQLPQLLRKVALVAYPRKNISQLISSDWEVWLDSECDKTEFNTRYCGQLNQLSYGEPLTQGNVLEKKQQAAGLIGQVSFWIRHHKGSFEVSPCHGEHHD